MTAILQSCWRNYEVALSFFLRLLLRLFFVGLPVLFGLGSLNVNSKVLPIVRVCGHTRGLGVAFRAIHC